MSEQSFLVMPITITRGVTFTDYVFIPSADDPAIGQDLTGYTLQAEVRCNGTLLATLTTTGNTAPPGTTSGQGWCQIYLDDADAPTAGYYRGTWSLLASPDGNNPVMVAGGPVDIMSQGTVWV
jgi:hypothetical protein